MAGFGDQRAGLSALLARVLYGPLGMRLTKLRLFALWRQRLRCVRVCVAGAWSKQTKDVLRDLGGHWGGVLIGFGKRRPKSDAGFSGSRGWRVFLGFGSGGRSLPLRSGVNRGRRGAGIWAAAEEACFWLLEVVATVRC